MKKLLSLLLSLTLLLSLCACHASGGSSGAPGGTTQGTQMPGDSTPQGTGMPGDNREPSPLTDLKDTAFRAQYIRTNGYVDGAVFPRVVIIRSAEELQAYYRANRNTFDLERKTTVYSDTTVGFLDACDRYDESYFEKQILIMVLLEVGSGSIRHEVTGVRMAKGNILDITIETITPEACTMDMAQWHILIEPGVGVDVESPSDVYINGNSLSGAPHAPTDAAEPRPSLTEPPEMDLVVDGERIRAVKGGYHWTVKGMSSIADAAHPLQSQKQLILSQVTASIGTLAFDMEPDAVSVRCWSDANWGNTDAESESVTLNGFAMELKPGGWIYEVEAKWCRDGCEGTVSYYLYVVSTPN